MVLLVYYPSKSAAAQEKKIKPPLSQWIQLRSEVSCILEDLDMKSTSSIGTHAKESLAPN